jgi:hypothetical protein
MPVQNQLPAHVRDALLDRVAKGQRFLNANPPDWAKLDDFTYSVDEVVTTRDLYFVHIKVDNLLHFKEVLLERLRAAQHQGRPWHWHELTAQERLARSEADACFNRIQRYVNPCQLVQRAGKNAKQQPGVRGRPPGSPTAQTDNKLFADWKAAHASTGTSKAQFLRERGLPETDLYAIERGRANHRRQQAGRKELDQNCQGPVI